MSSKFFSLAILSILISHQAYALSYSCESGQLRFHEQISAAIEYERSAYLPNRGLIDCNNQSFSISGKPLAPQELLLAKQIFLDDLSRMVSKKTKFIIKNEQIQLAHGN